jgi:CheY-like chemotaxis protein
MTLPQASVALPSLLLIDDDEISREVLSMTLEAHGFPIDTADNGAQALMRLEITTVDVILMDTQMPGLSGLELIKAIRRESSARLFAISGSEVSDAVRNACDGFLLKPIEPEDLVALLAASADSGTVGPEVAMPETKKTTHVVGAAEVIDPAVLARLTAMMPAASLREIYEAVAADLKKRLLLLEKAMTSGDSAEVGRLAHSVKGGSAMVGFTMATEAAARLETSYRPETWPKELAQLQDALAALERILGDEFPT